MNSPAVTQLDDASSKLLEQLMEDAISASVWTPRPIEEEPEITLTSWRVIELPATDDHPASRHFVGRHYPYGGRVSSAIVEFDAEAMRGVTRSGRVYALLGGPGVDRDGEYVLGVWLDHQGISFDDVRNVNVASL